jgi:histidine triad (HIT) family protein
MGGCIFCRIVAGEAPAQRLYEDERTLAIMDVNPITRGHVLVIPKAHAADLFSLGEEDYQAVMRTVRRVGFAAREAFKPDGLNLLQSSGRVAFQVVFHFHVHVLPRYEGDALRLRWIPRGAESHEIDQAADDLRSAIAKV